MTKVQSPKGTYDILPQSTQGQPWQQSHVWQELEARCRHMAALYNYAEVRTPIYERTELFDRGVGETSDIVSKEMFTFLDRGERSMSLRPEGTSSVMRAFLEGGLPQLGTMHKLFYIGPMFRYERPQSGRYRQHHQFGVEAIGSPLPEQDAEVIELLVRLYQGLGLKEIEVHLNSVGDLESRAHYRTALVNYLQPKRHALSEDSQVRLEKNPLRILDSKDPTDKEIIAEA
ncbi:MAG: Histidine--tRNA ligase, partial [Chlamydiota bacterium]